MPISVIPNQDPLETNILPSTGDIINQPEPKSPKPLEFRSPLQEISEVRYSASNSHLGEFGLVRHYRDGRLKKHDGVDMRCDVGTTVLASEEGIAHIKHNPEGYGLYVTIKHQNGYETLYGHLDSTNIQEGQTVHQGDPIGLSGISGNADTKDPHLHFEVKKEGVKIDPMNFLIGQSTLPLIQEPTNACLKI